MRALPLLQILTSTIMLLFYAQAESTAFLPEFEPSNEFDHQSNAARVLESNNCPASQFGPDCSIKATPLIAEEATSVIIKSNVWNYFYLDLIDIDKDHLKLSFQYGNGPLQTSLLFTSSINSMLPDTNIHSYNIQTSPANHHSWELEIPKNDLKSNLKASNNRLMIGVYHSLSQDVDLKIKPTFGSGSSTLTIILIIVGAVGVVINIIGCTYFIKYRLKKELELAVRQHFEGTNSHLTNHPMYYNRHNHRYELDPDAPLTQEDLNIYFPCTLFDKLKSPFGQVECPICLEEFKQDSECRQLYCEHIFHNRCIQFWLSKHQACPNCKKDMKRNAIVLHFAAQKRSAANLDNNDDKEHEDPLNTEGQVASEEASIVKANKMEDEQRPCEEYKIAGNGEQDPQDIEENNIKSKDDKVIIIVSSKSKKEEEKDEKNEVVVDEESKLIALDKVININHKAEESEKEELRSSIKKIENKNQETEINKISEV